MVQIENPFDHRSGDWAEQLYPDMVQRGGILRALWDEFAAIHPALASSLGPSWDNTFAFACIRRPPRYADVALAALERLFLLQYWARGVRMASGATSNFSDVVDTLAYWAGSSCLSRELSARFPFVRQDDTAEAYERGEEVEYRWRQYLTRPPWNAAMDPLIRVAARHPELRQLFPFTSLNILCFSRCTGYPFTRDTPCVVPLGWDRYQVEAPNGTVLGRGDAEAAVRLVIDHLPADCGPAVAGTADDLPETFVIRPTQDPERERPPWWWTIGSKGPEGHEVLDTFAPQLLGISGEEFLRRWDAGEYREAVNDPERPEIRRLAQLIRRPSTTS